MAEVGDGLAGGDAAAAEGRQSSQEGAPPAPVAPPPPPPVAPPTAAEAEAVVALAAATVETSIGAALALARGNASVLVASTLRTLHMEVSHVFYHDSYKKGRILPCP